MIYDHFKNKIQLYLLMHIFLTWNFTINMKTHIVLLRGINVTGHKVIKMDDLRNIFESMKFRDVKIYIQSGNIVLRDKEDIAGVLVKKIEAKLKKEFTRW